MNTLPLLAVAAALASGADARLTAAASLPRSDWRQVQPLPVPAPGLVKLSLPLETLGAARPGLEDLRLLDPSGTEVPYAVERVRPAEPTVERPRSFLVHLATGETVLSLETEAGRPIEGVTLHTSASDFLKAVAVEGSPDGETWTALGSGSPVFRQSGASQLHVPLPPGAWQWLRVRVDDQRSPPVAFTGADLHRARAESPADPCPVGIAGLVTVAGTTRLSLRLPAAHLQLATLELDTPEPLFTREVTVLAREVSELATNEIRLARATIYRLAVAGARVTSNLTVNLEAPVPSPELVVEIQNQDSPPLTITGVRARVRPVRLLFRAATSGTFELLVGNHACDAPRYDLGSLGDRLVAAPLSSIEPGPLAPNPDYAPPEPLPGVEGDGARLDVTAWRYRKPVKLSRAVVHALELDLEVLAGAAPDLADVRLMRGGTQVPFLRAGTTAVRRVVPEVAVVVDPDRPRVTRWQLQVPHARLPLARLTCLSPTPLFQRAVALSEEPRDERGVKYQRGLGSALWTQAPARTSEPLGLDLAGTPVTDTLLLETDNGDNPPIVLDHFEFTCPVPRLVFKLPGPATDLFLYYGNPKATGPRYDLGLVARELQSAEKATATLGPAEQLREGSWREHLTASGGPGKPLFWGVLGLVGVGLFVIMARLLPARPPPE